MGTHRPLRRALLLAPTLLVLACASPSAPVGPPLRVACDFTNPPFASFDEQGAPVGRDVALAEELARRLDRPLVWIRRPFGELIPTLEAGVADLAIATMGRTPERARRVAFSEAYLETGILVLVRAGEGEPRSIGDLMGRRLSAGAGTTSELAVRAHGLGDGLVAASAKEAPVLERLLAGELDAAVMDGPDALDFARGRDDLRVLPEALASEAYCVAVRPDAPELLDSVNAVLGELRASGWLSRLQS